MKSEEAITDFSGDHFFLSNFYISQLFYGGESYTTAEHAYQAAKATNEKDRLAVKYAHGPGAAKLLGNQIKLRKDWNVVKFTIMKHIVWTKFKNKELRKKLLATGDRALIEGNTWNDTIWGVCNGKGENHLGRILMEVRKAIREYS